MNSLKKYIFFVLFFFLGTISLNASEKIAFIDVDYILNNSILGKSILKELEVVNEQNVKKLSKKETIIKQKKNAINKTKNISSKEKLEQDIINFNKEVEQFVSQKDKILNDFKLLKELKLDNFLKIINPFIQNYMKKNSIDIVLEKKQIFIGNSNIDITKDIIKLINENSNNG